jgi:head-tail adaptor
MADTAPTQQMIDKWNNAVAAHAAAKGISVEEAHEQFANLMASDEVADLIRNTIDDIPARFEELEARVAALEARR